MNQWSIIFSDDDVMSVQVFLCEGDPQKAAQQIADKYPGFRLVCAVEGRPRILVKDSARTAECALQGD